MRQFGGLTERKERIKIERKFWWEVVSESLTRRFEKGKLHIIKNISKFVKLYIKHRE